MQWEALKNLAEEAMRNAYAPYSKYPVGAAAVTTDGRTFSGCNVENAALGVTLCAECGVISDLIRDGGGRLARICCVDQDGTLITPCGRCRQLLWEHGGPDVVIHIERGDVTIADLLPDAFDASDLNKDTP